MKLFYNEIYKTYRKWRTYIGFLAIGILVPLINIAMKAEGTIFMQQMMAGVQKDFFLVGNLLNGWFVTYLIMNSLWIHIPFLISLVAGDIFAGEATAGTYRILLIRPVSRTRIFIAKYAAAIFYTWTLVFFLGILSIGLGLSIFGSGELLIIDAKGILILAANEVWWRFLIAFVLATFAMVTVASLAMLFSSFVENAIGPIVGTMAVIIGFFVIGNLQISFFQAVRPYLFTTYLTIWTEVFRDPISSGDIACSSLALLGFSTGFSLLTWSLFTRKDIVS
jgi:ABC-2 type transport system permease protein